MRIGLDFDNTIVSYDVLFYQVALEQGLIPPNIHVNKVAVRDHLRSVDKEAIWTEMQGYVYGARMKEAQAFPGLFEVLPTLLEMGHDLFVVSHKTKHPFIGEKYDLHAAASGWISENLQRPGNLLIPRDQVFFELTKAEKIARIAELQCQIFIDDLPEILMADTFPNSTKRLLFDPENQHSESVPQSIKRVRGWKEIPVWVSEQQ